MIEGGQDGRFQYTCGNAECHAFIKPHERSMPATASVQPETPGTAATAPEPARVAPPSTYTVDAAVAALITRLAEVDNVLATVPSLKAERSKLRRMLAASQAKPVTVRPVITRASNGQVVGYALDTKAHQ